MSDIQTRPSRGMTILLLFSGIGFSSCGLFLSHSLIEDGKERPPEPDAPPQGVWPYGGPNCNAYGCTGGPYCAGGVCTPEKWVLDIQGIKSIPEFQRNYLQPSVHIQLSSISYDQTISSTDGDDKWKKGFTLDVSKVTNNNELLFIDVTLSNPGDLGALGYMLYRSDGAILEGWVASNNGTTTNNIPLNGLSRVNTFIMFFEQRDERLGSNERTLCYTMLPPITMILE